MPKKEESLKWACEYCTYLNWPCSEKCTLCCTPRPPQVITQESRRPTIVSEDIYEAASCDRIISKDPLICSSKEKNTQSAQLPEQIEDYVKWTCSSCTYENWPRSLYCSMCRTSKLKSGKNAKQLEPGSGNKDASSRSGSPRSPSLVGGNGRLDSKTINNDKNRALLRSNLKWICPQCTYENWPKTPKCALCKCLKPPKTKYDEIAKNSTSDNNVNTKRPSTSKRRSPNSSVSESALGIQPTHPVGEQIIYDIPASDDINDNEEVMQIRNRLKDSDWLWLSACIGVVEGETSSVNGYLNAGGDLSRQLTREDCVVLNRPGVFEVGHTLVHLAFKFKRDELITVLLTPEVTGHHLHRVPCIACPELAADVRKQMGHTIRQRKGDWRCYFFTDQVTFVLPAGELLIATIIYYFSFRFSVLEIESQVINWSEEITEQLGSRIYPLWNRSAGDCLLDSILQASYGVFDRDNTLRRALYDSLTEGGSRFFNRYKEWESMQAETLQYSLDEDQWEQDWASILSLAGQPGTSLEQTHVFALAHILRRPVIIYGVKYVKSFRGEVLGLARFQGVYLPVLWEQSFCWKNPLVLGYTRGHFSALVAMESDNSNELGAGANVDNVGSVHVTYLPLVDYEGKLLPVHFLSAEERGSEERLLREWLDCCVTEGGVLVAQQKVTSRPALLNQLIDDWLDRYRKLCKSK
ncbi:PREDICTED: LOW QUALITY PROTEIN: ubiquitin thioesterase Zranb1-like [Acropora digitifera]|uniref:LOW QUALITY PROTEIN: ubiquitin thioesterase Zranb1-like n=1 Tax=Acropora digitifera TaxID=70779 RepID=UPI00077B0D35|nr:PREDICTED: LOW QUALITY PROTEIN: ubiquitin thioesterase Zranb1-like [Acropora digitifera]